MVLRVSPKHVQLVRYGVYVQLDAYSAAQPYTEIVAMIEIFNLTSSLQSLTAANVWNRRAQTIGRVDLFQDATTAAMFVARRS